ncbi:UDP-N-acetylmuramoyl-L-alanine--D-glutamate ligase [Gordonia sp. L191]|uniref:UDP-N-acetylmuramoyl-L-alanine--D-glutamate ligase n=1 Tax=Gordonia sp. L191 TaxID=2982699 RepID=UPI0024C0C916|nr:UDP-N-acetylmuramoyl-L-alanine--D-glutamate ligase [Gordonia sp. L191]WHU49035.1 UDP-N-acetylmuramoyl-L-alanine--D-glutamate ligase [Gordonia sp. L191]
MGVTPLPGAPLPGRSVLVAGGGSAGMSAAAHLLDLGAQVTIADDRVTTAGVGAIAGASAMVDRGARLVAITELLADPTWTDRTDLAVVSPGFAPDHPLPVAAHAAGIPTWGEVELAWQLDAAGIYGPPRTWLVVTGTNGKTTTTSMLADIVTASGRAGAACGNIGLPVLDAMAESPRVDVLCAELSSFQLYWAPSIAPSAGVVLNVADDHLDWHGSFDAYAQAKQIALHGAVGVVGLDDPVAAALPVAGRRVGFTLSAPADGELGVRDGVLVDRAFGEADGMAGVGSAEGTTLADATGIRPPGPSGLADALAAAALARSIGVGPDAIRSALAAFRPAAHRGEVVAELDGIAFVDDSKATNPHAAQAAIAAHRRVILIAGGLLKDASLASMLDAVGDRLAGVVAIGRDRGLVVAAIARHAPEVPTVTVFTGDDGCVTVQRELSFPAGVDVPAAPGAPAISDGSSAPAPADAAVAVMDRAVHLAWALAAECRGEDRPDAILLAPAAASLDMFAGYGRRGDAFADAARSLTAGGGAVDEQAQRR